MKSAFLQLVIIRYKEFLREPGIIFWTIFFPILMAWGLGMAFSEKSEMVQSLSLIENNSHQNTKLRELLNTAEQDQEKGSTTYTIKIENDEFGNSVFHIHAVDSATASLNMKKGKTLIQNS